MAQMNDDSDSLTLKDHFWLIAVCLFVLNAFIWHLVTAYRDAPDFAPSHSRYHDASLDLETQPIRTTQAYYESEKATE